MPVTSCLCVFSRILGWRVFGQYIDERLARLLPGLTVGRLDYDARAYSVRVPWLAQLSDVATARYRIAALARAESIRTDKFDAIICQGHDLLIPFVETKAAFIGVIADSTPAIAKRRVRPLRGACAMLKRVVSEWQDRVLFRPAFRRVDSFLVLSTTVKQSLIEDYGIDSAKVHVVGPPVRDKVARLGRRERRDRPVILFAGNDFERKGGSFLLGLFARHFADRAELCIVSNGVDPARLDPGVALHSNIPNEAVLSLMLESRVFVFPSQHDELGLVLAEAAAAGLPIVARESGGQAEYVRDGENGYLLPAEATETEWAEAIAKIIDDRKLWARFSQRSLEIADQLCTDERFDRQFLKFVGGMR